MLERLQQFDMWLLERVFERFSCWFQCLTGRDCFWLARASARCSYAGPIFVIVTAAILLLFDKVNFTDIDVLVFACATFGTLIVFVSNKMWEPLIEETRKQTQRAHDMGCMNPRKNYNSGSGPERFFAIVIIILTLTAYEIPFSPMFFFKGTFQHLLLYLLFVGIFVPIVCVVYFIACDPFPPGKSKIRKWIGAIKEKFSLGGEEVPVPA